MDSKTMAAQPATAWPGKLIKLEAVTEKVGIGRDTIYRLARAGKFPKPIKVGAFASRFSEVEVDQYLRDRAALRDGAAV